MFSCVLRISLNILNRKNIVIIFFGDGGYIVMHSIKYLHVIFFNDIKFYSALIDGINGNIELNPKDHVFITDKESVYEKIKSNRNCYLINFHMLYGFMKKSKWVIFHSMPLKKWEFCLLPNYICKKIIWRTWGHDIRPCSKTNNSIYDVLKHIEFCLFKNKVKSIYAMGIANEIDIINIEEVLKTKFKYFQLNYSNSEKIIDYLEKLEPVKHGKNIKILIGHNCSPVDNHLEILDKLIKYKNEQIHLVIPLSYSDPKNGYKEKVIDRAYELFGKNKVTIISDFMPIQEYIKLISSIDIAIMDMFHSNGLGNISFILYFKKKLFIRKDGNIDKAFLNSGINPNYTCDIGRQSFTKFIDNQFDFKYHKFCSAYLDKDSFKKSWLKFMEECEGENEQ